MNTFNPDSLVPANTQTRDSAGRYDVAFDKMCVCGHPMAHHGSDPSHRLCLWHEVGTSLLPNGKHPPACGCNKFRRSRKK